MSIKDNIKSSFYSGIGLMLKSKESIELAAKKFIKENKMSKEEGEKFVSEAMSKAKDIKKDVQTFVEENVDKVLKKMNIVKREEYNELKKKYEKLQKEFDKTKK